MPIGNLTYYYLKIAAGPEIRGDPNAIFLAWENGAFKDVTAQVRSGQRPVKFFDRRPTH